jgi:alpha-tubulin suppressor-like RCC1 family protein
VPVIIDDMKNVVDISCGDYYSVAVNKEGKVFTWGYGNDGQLGHHNNLDVRTPKELQFNEFVT